MNLDSWRSIWGEIVAVTGVVVGILLAAGDTGNGVGAIGGWGWLACGATVGLAGCPAPAGVTVWRLVNQSSKNDGAGAPGALGGAVEAGLAGLCPPTEVGASTVLSLANISFSIWSLARPNFAADNCLSALPNSGLADPNGGKVAMLKDCVGIPPINIWEIVLKFGIRNTSSRSKIGENFLLKLSASASEPTRNATVVPTLPNTASRISSVNWVVNWLATIKLRWYFLASDMIVAKESVAKFWNSSTYRQKSCRSASGISARLMAAAWNFITKIIPNSFEFNSPVRPLDKLTNRIFLLSIMSLRLNELFCWPMILRIISLDKNAPNLLTTQLVTSPASFDFCEFGHSLVQKSNTLRSVTYCNLAFINSESISSFGISTKVPPLGSAINSKALLVNIRSNLGPIIPCFCGSYSL